MKKAGRSAHPVSARRLTGDAPRALGRWREPQAGGTHEHRGRGWARSRRTSGRTHREGGTRLDRTERAAPARASSGGSRGLALDAGCRQFGGAVAGLVGGSRAEAGALNGSPNEIATGIGARFQQLSSTGVVGGGPTIGLLSGMFSRVPIIASRGMSDVPTGRRAQDMRGVKGSPGGTPRSPTRPRRRRPRVNRPRTSRDARLSLQDRRRTVYPIGGGGPAIIRRQRRASGSADLVSGASCLARNASSI